MKQVGRELGVRYVLEGQSARQATSAITGQLIDATTGTHLWADRFDGSLKKSSNFRTVAFSVAGVIESTLQAAEIKRSTDRPTTDLPPMTIPARLPNCYAWDKERIFRRSISLRGRSSATRNLARPSR